MLNVDYQKSGVEPETLKWTIRQVQKDQVMLTQQVALNQMANKMFGTEQKGFESSPAFDDLQRTQKI